MLQLGDPSLLKPNSNAPQKVHKSKLISDSGVVALASMFPTLVSLNLRSSALGSQGWAALGSSLTALTRLHVSETNVSDADLALLAQGCVPVQGSAGGQREGETVPFFPALRVLEVGVCGACLHVCWLDLQDLGGCSDAVEL